MSRFPYTDEQGRAIKPAPLTFEIVWLDYSGDEFATDKIKRIDLSAAITTAANQLKAAKGNARDAQGFFVRAGKTRGDLAMNETCEGYTNYATFGVAVTLDNDRKMSEQIQALTFAAIDNAPTDENVTTVLPSGNSIWTVNETERFRLADALKDYVERLCERGDPAPMVAQMVQAGLVEVDWADLAATYLGLAKTEWER